MSDNVTPCPTPEQLRALVNSSLSDVDFQTIQSHVDGCQACQQTLESLVAGSESWDSALGHLRNEPVLGRETVLSEAIRRMKDEEFEDSHHPDGQSKNTLDFLSPSDQPGSIGKIGTYEVTEVVGRGGMGVVLKAFDPSLHRVVAVKVLAPYLAHNPQARKRFVREAQAIAAVSHDHVITIHAIDESAEQPNIVMQYVAGRSLQQKIDAEGSLDLKEILRIGMQTAAGLSAAHAQGLVHRDVKPSNILLENGIQRVKLTDFGLARAVDDASLTQSGAIAGTPQYMAPEQANGDAVDYRADLFSLGSVLYAMCVGHSPFRASTTMGVLKRVCHDPPRPIQELNPDIPDWLCAIIMKLLAKKPEDRYPSAKAVAELLEKWLAHVQQPMAVPKPTYFSESSPRAQTNPADPVRLARRELDARTIFFQPVSGRWLLFFLLLGMALTLGFTRVGNSKVEFPEALFVSFAGGLVACFWGLIIVAVVRMIWANLYGYVPWVAKPADEISAAQSRQYWLGLRPESLAALAAIVMMLLSFNPLIAAIVAIIVWRSASMKSDNIEQMDNMDSASADSPQDMSRNQKFFAERVAWAQDLPQRGWDQLRHGVSYLGSFLQPATPEMKHLLLAIGWCLVGGFDLLVAMVVGEDVVLLTLGSLALSMISFVVSYSIQRRQNFRFVKRMSYLGLLPLSAGALGRIPLSIITLLWLNSSTTQNAFEQTPWSESGLGLLLKGTASFIRRSIGTAFLTLLWTVSWVAIVTAAFWLYVLPYGPSAYEVKDRAKVIMKGQPKAQFHLTASSSGTGVGIVPPSSLQFEEVVLESAGNNAPNRLKVQFGATVPINAATNQMLTISDVEKCLSDFDQQKHPEQAANLFYLIQRMKTQNDLAWEEKQSPQYQTYSDRMKVSVDLWRRHLNSQLMNQPWPGFTRVSSMLNPELFEISLDHDLSTFDCYVEIWFCVAGAILSALIWLITCGWILKRRHFHKTTVRPVAGMAAA